MITLGSSIRKETGSPRRLLCHSCGAVMLGPNWLQLNLVLPEPTQAGPEDLHPLFEEIFLKVDHLKKQRALRCFFFLRKPPGIRLRFALAAPEEDTASEIESCFRRLVKRKLVTRLYRGSYEPETFKFGGPDGINAVHAHFFADSTAWWSWEQLRCAAVTRLNAKLLSVGVLNDLFSQCLEGPEEIWDVWCRLAVLHGASVLSDGSAMPRIGIEQLLEQVTPKERSLLRKYVACNRAIARKLDAISAKGKLLFGIRQVLPHVAIYHWNRYGFTESDRTSMLTAGLRAWSPHVPALAMSHTS